MTIADLPVWAQTPTAELVREIAIHDEHTEPSERFGPLLVRMFYATDEDPTLCGPIVAFDNAGALSVGEALDLWHQLGDLLAIEATDPAEATLPTVMDWETDTDGTMSRFKCTSPVATGAMTANGDEVEFSVDLYDRVDDDMTSLVTDEATIAITHGRFNGIPIATAEDARRLAFELLHAARIADMVTAAAHE